MFGIKALMGDTYVRCSKLWCQESILSHQRTRFFRRIMSQEFQVIEGYWNFSCIEMQLSLLGDSWLDCLWNPLLPPLSLDMIYPFNSVCFSLRSYIVSLFIANAKQRLSTIAIRVMTQSSQSLNNENTSISSSF